MDDETRNDESTEQQDAEGQTPEQDAEGQEPEAAGPVSDSPSAPGGEDGL